MAYQRKIWGHGDQPTAAALNNIEDGISGAEAQDELIRSTIDGIEERIEQDENDIIAETYKAQDFNDDYVNIANTKRATQNICLAYGYSTGNQTVFDVYQISYQPFVNLFFDDNVAKGLRCMVAGSYFVQVDVCLRNTDATLNLLKNGSVVEGVARLQTNKSTVIDQRVMGFSLVTLEVGDVISFAVNRSTSTYNTGFDLNITIYKIA